MNEKFGKIIAYIAIGMSALIVFLLGCVIIVGLLALIKLFF